MIEAGFSRKVITPDYPVLLGGYAARSGLSRGIHDDLYAKVCYLKDRRAEALIISCDLLSIPNDVYGRIKDICNETYGINNIFLSATHTHSGPETRKTYDIDGVNSAWRESLIPIIVSAIGEAIENRKPSIMKYAGSCVPEVGKNRRQGETSVDSDLGLLSFEDEEGRISGVIINYACHCTVLDSSNYLISSDYPQYIYSRLEKEFPGSVAIFLNGAAGNINIGYSADASALGVEMKGIRTFENAEAKATILCREIERILLCANVLEPAMSAFRLDVAFPVKRSLPEPDSLRNEIKRLEAMQNGSDISAAELEMRRIYYECLLNNIIEYPIVNGAIHTSCLFLRIGDVLLVSFPGELFCEIGLQIKHIFNGRYHVMIIGYCNGYYGYFPTEKSAVAGGYECETSVNGKEFEKYFISEIRRIKEGI